VSTEHPIFSLQSARELLPQVKHLTAEAVRAAEAVAAELQRMPETHPDHEALSTTLRNIVNDWASQLSELGVEAKGLWLVDFDNGEGYYCWSYPEETLSHYHAYEDGFAGRMKIQ
jgi:hypothetical protein